MDEETKQGGYISQAWLVILLALLYGGALAGVQTTLGPIIAENKKNETYDVIPELIDGAEKSKTVERTVTDATGKERRIYQANGADGKHLGWVIPAGGQGFADRIELLLGVNSECTIITGLYVLDQKETPGLGNFITEEDFRDQFVDKSAVSPLVVVKADPAPDTNEIRALTGATISSDSVAGIVNTAIADLKGPISKLDAEKPPETTDDPKAEEGEK